MVKKKLQIALLIRIMFLIKATYTYTRDKVFQSNETSSYFKKKDGRDKKKKSSVTDLLLMKTCRMATTYRNNFELSINKIVKPLAII